VGGSFLGKVGAAGRVDQWRGGTKCGAGTAGNRRFAARGLWAMTTRSGSRCRGRHSRNASPGTVPGIGILLRAAAVPSDSARLAPKAGTGPRGPLRSPLLPHTCYPSVGGSLFQPNVLQPPAVVHAVGHCRETLEPRVPTRR